jgi:hypothetical protein
MKLRPCGLGPGISIPEARSLDRNFTDASALPERLSSVALDVPGPVGKWRTDFLFDYAIFPPSILQFDAEWNREGRGMAVGDVILQRAFVPPIGFGMCLSFAVRICSVFKETARIGFAYETLTGHAESGVSEFLFEERAGGVAFTIHTFSQPGHWSSRFAQNLVTLPYQAWCTARALNSVRRRFVLENEALSNQR